MDDSKDPLDRVVVVTGASSGIGRATAVHFARAGARVVIAARDAAGLEETQVHCDAAGHHALAQPTDVRDEAQVDALAAAAVREHGRLDVWVNNAGVGAIGRFEDLPADVFRDIVETDFFGVVHGARAALRQFRQQGKGVLIDVSSIAGEVPTPLQSPYVSAKFAVRGFTDTLWQELRDDPGIDVATILPGPVDTPFWQNLANFSGRRVKDLPAAVDADKVAEAIVDCARSPRRHVYVGLPARVSSWQHRLAPRLTDRMMSRVAPRALVGSEPAPHTAGSVDPRRG
jgi:NAD(P)-dependent dehydrogenase (short-subunit alcohol dehydrogenase family)